MSNGVQAKSRSLVCSFQQAPCPALRAIIKRFLVIEFPPFYRDAHLPESDAVAAFSFQGACRINGNQWASPTAFTGPRDVLRTHEHRYSHAVVLAMFTPVGAFAFLRLPPNEFVGATVNLAEIIDRPNDVDQLSERLTSAGNHRQRVALVQSLLLARMRASRVDPLITAAVSWLDQGKVDTRIEDLVRYIGLSQSALERRFQRIIGVSPKNYASLIRLRRAVRLQATGVDLTTVAHVSGYFDQSHFIKEFRRAVGTAPSAFFGPNSPK
jgi:AraC-like DNA-binding protein